MFLQFHNVKSLLKYDAKLKTIKENVKNVNKAKTPWQIKESGSCFDHQELTFWFTLALNK